MPHEYAVNGILSLKSDVYSFGVIVLEILSGIRSSHYKVKHPDHDHNLLGQVTKTHRMLCYVDFTIEAIR